jgi:hypothetical protein
MFDFRKTAHLIAIYHFIPLYDHTVQLQILEQRRENGYHTDRVTVKHPLSMANGGSMGPDNRKTRLMQIIFY